MLRFIRIRNLAVIESTEVEFSPGFNVLTGETGAGKSIVADAVDLLLGGRASVGPGSHRPGPGHHRSHRSRRRGGSWSSAARSPRRDAAARSSTALLVTASQLRETRRRAGGPARAARAAAAAGSRHPSRDAGSSTGAWCRPGPASRSAGRSCAACATRSSRASMDARERAARLEWLAFQIAEFEAVQPREGEDEALAGREAGAAARRPGAAALPGGLRSAGRAGRLGAEHARRRLEAGRRAGADRRRVRTVRGRPGAAWAIFSTTWRGRFGPPGKRWRTPAIAWPASRIGWPGWIG